MKKLLEVKVAMLLAAALLMGVAVCPVHADDNGNDVGDESPVRGDMPQ